MSKFKIENFCEEHNSEFKTYYNYLNNSVYIKILITCLSYINHPTIQTKILNMIKEHKKIVYEKLNKIDIIINFYKQNNLIEKSEIGKFFIFYEKNKKNINLKNNEDLLKLFNILINYDKVISVLKECFYIFSDYRACIYFMTPSIDFYNTSKKIINNVILNFRDNLNTMNQIISKIYVGDENPLGSHYYSTAYSMFETLFIIKKYFSDPLKIVKIKFNVIKKCSEKQIIEKLCDKYHNTKLKDSELDNKINKKNVHNISQLILNLKRLGYDLWFVLPLVFNTIYEKYEVKNIPESLVFGKEKLYFQKMNNQIGFMCYVLVSEGYVSNGNIFNNFND
jgi:hypothetical protein